MKALIGNKRFIALFDLDRAHYQSPKSAQFLSYLRLESRGFLFGVGLDVTDQVAQDRPNDGGFLFGLHFLQHEARTVIFNHISCNQFLLLLVLPLKRVFAQFVYYLLD